VISTGVLHVNPSSVLRMEKQPPEGEPKDQQLQMFIRKKVAERVAELEKK
jgi:hypothetical protein